MAVDYKQVYRDLHDFVVLVTGLPDESVRPAYTNASAQPSQDRDLLCSINIINITEIGIDGVHNANQSAGTDVEQTIVGDRNITASLKFYGETARDTVEKVVLGLKAFASVDFLNKKNIGYLRHSTPLDISSLQNGEWEIRQSLDVEFHIKTSVTSDVNAIESAELGYAFYGSEKITGKIEVNQ